MPELPEVESARVYVLNYIKNKKITQVNFPVGFDDIIMKGCDDEKSLLKELQKI